MRSTALSLGRAGLLAATAITVPLAGQEGVEEVIVTGTYIRRPSQFDSPSPLVLVEAKRLKIVQRARRL